MNDWQAVIGLEIHVQLNTRSKLFSGASTAYGAEPNTQASWVDVALPGTLPVPNIEAIRKAVTFGLAVGADVAAESIFARKNYFYPDSPKGYQISQYERPIVAGGTILARLDDGREITVQLTRAHLEEDAGKSVHDAFHAASGIDLNRAGTALIEVVSEPVMHSSAEAVAYMKAVHRLVRWLDICDGNLQEGSFRCDANVSVHQPGTPFGTRCEIKNVNSFRFVEKAIDYEIERQIRAIENGERIVQETRLYDAAANKTRTMRSKEDAEDYRYFPDPDLPPIRVTATEFDALRATLPELPDARRSRYIDAHGLTAYDANKLTEERSTSDYFEAVANALPGHSKLVANWVNGELAAALNEAQSAITASRIGAPALAGLLARIVDGTISGKIAKDVFAAMWAGEQSADAIIDARGLRQISDSGAIGQMLDDVLAQFPEQVAKYRAGDAKLFQFLVGQAMKATKGKANPTQVNELLRERLGVTG
ncbi:MAG: Asp-tRNA(Asn)/Glu-tRNA(Gln) amidotransferase subunit GatB [Rhodanobacteraceae bacterium]|nr:Asp-tRNA(Asn)/Glu-tRNA(Gln) amidotransferase subunit GatB [Rhodanobacteraceae bacterium]MBK7044147.1 Asp-tRNA(Asn)/Glu-tRNA(Gln) amidotransferase subunit GatB [Rhodanobacteraceae bacterium]MBP9154406.1 Asp-tRNA(Asn)/Glu-tRNA(Gln) amidotransferase subunit GatB [Xanthomonadales bacterium]HQW81595.1 Asp-tRNA(Asn)/Glu-tRNA(Gln) amidotransferase subunit GatB [Pseudomonadota bacterium]